MKSLCNVIKLVTSNINANIAFLSYTILAFQEAENQNADQATQFTIQLCRPTHGTDHSNQLLIAKFTKPPQGFPVVPDLVPFDWNSITVNGGMAKINENVEQAGAQT